MYERSPTSSSSSALESAGIPSSHSHSGLGSGSNRFRSGYESSHSDDRSRRLPQSRSIPPQKQPSKFKWFSQVKDWLSVSEPSAQAFKQQKIKSDVGGKGSQSVVGFGIPSGQIPAGATTSATGPSPEKALLRQLKERKARESLMTSKTTTSTSLSSRESYSYAGSVKEINQATPPGW